MKIHMLPGVGSAPVSYQLADEHNRNLGFIDEEQAWKLVLCEGVPVVSTHHPETGGLRRTRTFEKLFDLLAPVLPPKGSTP